MTNTEFPPAPPHRRKRRRSHRRARRRFAAFCGIAIIALAACGAWLVRDNRPSADERARAESRDLLLQAMSAPDVSGARPVYAYSVIPGGVYTADEFKNATQRDPVVAAVYGALSPANLRVETVSADRLAYMSYRRDGKVYWTNHKLRLKEGETILTDGSSEIRARCGNGISMEPMQPTAEADPEELALDAVVAPLAGQPLPSRALAFAAIPGGAGSRPPLDSSALFGPNALLGAAPVFFGDFPPASNGPDLPGLGPVENPGFNPGPEFPPVAPPFTFNPGSPAIIPIPGGLTPSDDNEIPFKIDEPTPPGGPNPPGGNPRLPENPPENPVATPEPGTMIMVLSGAGLMMLRRRAARNKELGR